MPPSLYGIMGLVSLREVLCENYYRIPGSGDTSCLFIHTRCFCSSIVVWIPPGDPALGMRVGAGHLHVVLLSIFRVIRCVNQNPVECCCRRENWEFLCSWYSLKDYMPWAIRGVCAGRTFLVFPLSTLSHCCHVVNWEMFVEVQPLFV